MIDEVGKEIPGLRVKVIAREDTYTQLRKDLTLASPHIIVGCIGALDLFVNNLSYVDPKTGKKKSYLTLTDVRMLVLDEADRMADSQFEEIKKKVIYGQRKDKNGQTTMRKLLNNNPSPDFQIQCCGFSGTYGDVNRRQINTLFDIIHDDDWMNQRDPFAYEHREEISVFPSHNVSHYYQVIPTRPGETVESLKKVKFNAMMNLARLFTNGKMIVFFHRTESADEAFDTIRSLIRDCRNRERRAFFKGFTRSFDSFRNSHGNKRILLTTSLHARGIDVPQVSVVLNFDLTVTADYKQRTGRAGRFLKTGTAITFVTEDQLEFPRQKKVGGVRAPRTFAEAKDKWDYVDQVEMKLIVKIEPLPIDNPGKMRDLSGYMPIDFTSTEDDGLTGAVVEELIKRTARLGGSIKEQDKVLKLLHDGLHTRKESMEGMIAGLMDLKETAKVKLQAFKRAINIAADIKRKLLKIVQQGGKIRDPYLALAPELSTLLKLFVEKDSNTLLALANAGAKESKESLEPKQQPPRVAEISGALNEFVRELNELYNFKTNEVPLELTSLERVLVEDLGVDPEEDRLRKRLEGPPLIKVKDRVHITSEQIEAGDFPEHKTVSIKTDYLKKVEEGADKVIETKVSYASWRRKINTDIGTAPWDKRNISVGEKYDGELLGYDNTDDGRYKVRFGDRTGCLVGYIPVSSLAEGVKLRKQKGKECPVRVRITSVHRDIILEHLVEEPIKRDETRVIGVLTGGSVRYSVEGGSDGVGFQVKFRYNEQAFLGVLLTETVPPAVVDDLEKDSKVECLVRKILVDTRSAVPDFHLEFFGKVHH